MKKPFSALVACAVLAASLPLISAPALAKKPVPRTASAQATANHNAKIDAEKARKASAKAAKASKSGKKK